MIFEGFDSGQLHLTNSYVHIDWPCHWNGDEPDGLEEVHWGKVSTTTLSPPHWVSVTVIQ